MKNNFYKNQVWLTKRYSVDKKTVDQIAAECGVSDQTILNYLNKFNLMRKRG